MAQSIACVAFNESSPYNNSRTYYSCRTCCNDDSELANQNPICYHCAVKCHKGHRTTRYYEFMYGSAVYEEGVCSCSSGQFPVACSSTGGGADSDEEEEVAEEKFFAGWLSEQGTNPQVFTKLRHWFKTTRDELFIYKDDQVDATTVPLANFELSKIRIADRGKLSSSFFIFSSYMVIECEAENVAQKREWLTWIAGEEKDVVRTMHFVAKAALQAKFTNKKST